MAYVILDAQDADRLLRMLYHGERPPRVHTLHCACGARADLRMDEAAWNGWRVLPNPCCPDCLSHDPYPGTARKGFLELLGTGWDG